MIDDLRLMIEKEPLQSAIIDHRSKMLPTSILTRQEMLAKLAPVCARLPAQRVQVQRTVMRKVWDKPESKAEAGR
ncbi:MAG TPA: hypothetical protein P5308_06065 [Syntrophales bacterium]|nr:hypothetical protein [Syntrophales bacterium]